MRTYNVMTACDENYARLIYPQLASLDRNLGGARVNFFLLHARVTAETVAGLASYAASLSNVEFHSRPVTEGVEEYNEIAKYSSAGATGMEFYPFEVFFPLDCHRHLPEWVDRALYVHSADTIFLGDLADFYDMDFDGKCLGVEVSTGKIVKRVDGDERVLYEATDRAEFIAKYKYECAFFNSGAVMLNVDRFRSLDRPLTQFLAVRDEMVAVQPEASSGVYYNGDQAFFSAAFLGDAQPLEAPRFETINRRRFNYSPVVLYWRAKDGKVPVEDPRVVHFDSKYKPWVIAPGFFDRGVPSNLDEAGFLAKRHGFAPVAFQEYFKAYWDYVRDTPVEAELVARATAASKKTKRVLRAEHFAIRDRVRKSALEKARRRADAAASGGAPSVRTWGELLVRRALLNAGRAQTALLRRLAA